MDYQVTYDVIRAALDATEPRPDYARQTAEQWLAAQPGHLTISVLLAESYLQAGQARTAFRILRDLLKVDPEHPDGLALASRLYRASGNDDLAWAAAAALQQVRPGDPLARVNLAGMTNGSHGRPAKQADSVTAEFLALIPALVELERIWRQGETETARSEAKRLLQENPYLVKAHLVLGDCLMAAGDDLAAVEHIHQAASLDPGGEVAQRLWDGEKPYLGAWPGASVPGAPGPIPHAVASALGWNLLEDAGNSHASTNGNGKIRRWPAGNGATASSKSPAPPEAPAVAPPLSAEQEMLIDIQAEIQRLSGRMRQRADKPKTRKERKTDVQLRPIYALIANKQGLQAKYGDDGWQQIDGALQALAKAAESRLGLPAGVVYIDDAPSLASFELDPVDPGDPAAVKTLFNQMDARLEDQNRELGWLLLVGGDDLIAFHRLPNPAHDDDAEVLSDNPYGCRDENYFLPHRAIGRMPDGVGSDPTVLLRSISTALAAHHAARRSTRGGLMGLLQRLLWLLRVRRSTVDASFGYSASVWRKASLEVFKQIGSTRQLRISPPVTSGELNALTLGPARYSYFNLHGIADGPAWYGQRDPTFPADYPDFPVALRPEDLNALGGVPEVVFSEACYGTYLPGKTVDTALSLKFLSAGAHMVVGSTCIAYGGVTTPLQGADRLAHYFWQELTAGRSGGGALQQAKLAFAQFLDENQGYLDGEDQKTLISFVYYGDPTLPATPNPYSSRSKSSNKTWAELIKSPPRVCAKGLVQDPDQVVSPELAEQVRTRVANYLPGMEKAKMMVARQRICQGNQCEGQCEGCRPGSKLPTMATDRMVITLQKSAQVAGQMHEQLVKVTVDETGKMLKLAVSK